jgi:hypothetical protein
VDSCIKKESVTFILLCLPDIYLEFSSPERHFIETFTFVETTMRIFKKQETLVQSLSNPGDVSEHRNGSLPSSKGIAEFKDNFENQATPIATQWSIFQPDDRCKADSKPVRKSED